MKKIQKMNKNPKIMKKTQKVNKTPKITKKIKSQKIMKKNHKNE